MKMQGNEVNLPTYKDIDISRISNIYSEPNLAYGTGKTQANKANKPIYLSIVDETHASSINSKYNFAHGAVKLQGNDSGIPSYQSIDEFHAGNITLESNLAYGAVKLQANKADIPAYQCINESHASIGNTESNLAYGTGNTGSEVSIPLNTRYYDTTCTHKQYRIICTYHNLHLINKYYISQTFTCTCLSPSISFYRLMTTTTNFTDCNRTEQ